MYFTWAGRNWYLGLLNLRLCLASRPKTCLITAMWVMTPPDVATRTVFNSPHHRTHNTWQDWIHDALLGSCFIPFTPKHRCLDLIKPFQCWLLVVERTLRPKTIGWTHWLNRLQKMYQEQHHLEIAMQTCPVYWLICIYHSLRAHWIIPTHSYGTIRVRDTALQGLPSCCWILDIKYLT